MNEGGDEVAKRRGRSFFTCNYTYDWEVIRGSRLAQAEQYINQTTLFVWSAKLLANSSTPAHYSTCSELSDARFLFPDRFNNLNKFKRYCSCFLCEDLATKSSEKDTTFYLPKEAIRNGRSWKYSLKLEEN
jgi:hypothetical protein